MKRIDGSSVCRSRSPLYEAPRRRRDRTRVGALLVLLAMGSAPIAFAQTTDGSTTTTTTPTPKKKKKGAKAAASASASATDDTPPPPPPPAPAPDPDPSASASTKDSAPKDAKADTASAATDDITDTKEDPAKKYYFVGLRYRGTIIPQFFESLFVDDGGTVYSNTLGLEVDIRQDGRSIIPWFQYTDYGMGNTLFLTKGKDPTDATQYSVVNSGLKALYLGLDEMWSAPLADHFDFEYGFGVGIGFVFGSLQNNWVYQDPNGAFHSSSGGLTLSECPSGSQYTIPSCMPMNHQGSSVSKVGGYVEPNWFNGGAVPVVFPQISIPQIGIRYKPIKQVEARLQVGFSITGFWWALSVDYGLEQNDKTDKTETKSKSKDTDKGTDGSDKGDKN
jgi:hypothetical protein